MNKSNHPFHLVTISPWPLVMALSLMIMFTGVVKWFFEHTMTLFILGIFLVILTMYQWSRDVIRESTFQGCHTHKIMTLIKYGMTLFITSEIYFFLAFFWAFFHSSLSPNIEIGSMWPPLFIEPLNPYNVPLLNTITLLSSGVTITWCHYSILNKKYFESMILLIMTVMLGIYFTILQWMEYNEASFTISDSIYGSVFYMITGFHGLHVIIGTMFISIMFMRLKKFHFSSLHHLGFEISAWYWHFVDVVWLFVYMFLYWWSY